MKLDKLNYKGCPVCGARVVREGVPRFHTCGEGFEFQEFKCGCVVKWSPNFSCEEIDTQCPKHPEEVARETKREEAHRKLKRYIDRLDVDEDWKSHKRMYLL